MKNNNFSNEAIHRKDLVEKLQDKVKKLEKEIADLEEENKDHLEEMNNVKETI